MSLPLRQRKMETNIVDRENLDRRPGKVAVSKPLVTRRPALGELGNKLAIQERNQNIATKQPVTVKPTVPHVVKQTTLKAQKQTTKTVSKNETEEKSENLTLTQTSSSFKRQESTLLKHVVRVANDHKIGKEISYSTKQLLGIIDIDANDKEDPFLVAEYIQDIFGHLRSLESDYKIRENYLVTHHSSARMRSVLVNWMVDVHINFKFLLETLHLSVAVLDRYLQINNSIGRETLQLVGTTAMIIAGKYEEMYMPELSDFVYICDNTFSRTQILKMELEILSKLNWNFGRPLALHFLRRYNKIARIQPDHHNLAKYLLEIFLLEYELCHIDPSLQAAAACCLSISILNGASDPSKVWNKTLAYYSTYKYSDIKQVVINLAYFLGKMEKSKFQAIRKKYANANLGKISLHPKLQGPLVKRLMEEAQSLKKS